MINTVNTVLVGKAQKTAYSSINSVQDFAAGDIFMVDGNGTVIKTEAEAAAAKEVKIGLIGPGTINYTAPDGSAATLKPTIFSNVITKESIQNYTPFAFAAKSEDVLKLAFGSFVPVVGHRYVVRIIYRDLYEHPGQFTHTYEVIASTTTLADLVGAFVKLINKDTRRRVVATAADSNASIVLTAMEKTDNEGKESINEYTQVNMTAGAYYTDPSAAGFASKNKYPIAGLTITKTPGKPGKGNPKIIRDREKFALSYRGITNRTWFPVIKPDLLVDLSKSYDGFILEFNPTHKNAQDDFSKTKQSVEVYVENGTTYTASLLKKLMDAFTTGVVPVQP